MLVWNENFPTRIEALEAEFRIKKWSRKKKEALISGDWDALKIASMPPNERNKRLSTSLETNGEKVQKNDAHIEPDQDTPNPSFRREWDL